MNYPPMKTPADVSKLHAESNQLRNQQFTLATMGIGAIAISSWLIPLLSKTPSSGIPQAFVAIFLLILLTVLFIWSIFLRRLIGAISHYLDLRNESEWEALFRVFSTTPGTTYRSQTTMLFVVFLVLGFIPVGEYLLLVVVDMKVTLDAPQSVAVLVSGLAYLIALLALTLRRGSSDQKARTNWEELLKKKLSDTSNAQQ
jgi:hypothetical protein